MNNMYAAALFLSAFVCALVALFSWLRRYSVGTWGLTILMLAMFIWSSTYAIRWIVPAEENQLFWIEMSFIGVSLAPTAMLIFALQFSGQSKLLVPRNLAILSIEPIFTQIFLWTDNYHGLFFGGLHSTNTIYTGGLWFWFNAIYSYALILTALGSLISYMRETIRVSRRGVGIVIAGILLPVFSTIVGVLGISPFPNLDITPFFFTLSGICFSIGLLHYHILDLMPIAYNHVIETMGDGLMVLDGQKRLVDINPAARFIFPNCAAAIGSPYNGIFNHLPKLMMTLEKGEDTKFEIDIENGHCRVFEVTLSHLAFSYGEISGWLLIFHDVTRFKETEAALIHSESKIRSLFTAMTDVILVLDKDGRYLEIAPTNPSNLARDPFNLVGKTVFDIFPADLANLFMETITKTLETRQIVSVDYSMKIDDREVWFAGNVSPLTEDSVTWVARDITERKISEIELRASEERLRFIIKHDPNAVAVYDKNLNYIAVSDRYLLDYGVKENDVIGKHHYEVFPEMPERWKEIHQRVLAGATERNEDDSFMRPDGSITYNSWECRPWFRPDGKIGGMITYTEVTTGRKVIEIALRESEQRLRSLFAAMTDVIFVLDINGRYLEIAPTNTKGLKGDADTILGKTVQEVLPEETAENLLHTIRTCLQDNTPAQTAYDLDINGEIHWFSATASPLTKETVILVAHDITELIHTNQALREKETQYQEIVTTMTEGVIVVDLDEKILFANPAFHTMLGVKHDSLIGKNMADFVLPSSLELIQKQTQKRITGRSDTYEFEIRHQDGSPRLIQVSVHPQMDSNGKVVSSFGVCRDVTESRKIQQSLRESNNRLVLAQRLANLGSWEYDFSTMRLWVSDEIYKILGIDQTSEFLSVRKILNRFVPEDRRRFSDVIKSFQEGVLIKEEEYRLLATEDRDERVVHGIANQVFDGSGKVIKISGVLRDITDQKRTEKALEKRVLALTQPLESAEDITFEELFNLEDIQHLQDQFAEATGVASIITSTDGTPITRPSNFCRLCKDIIRETPDGRVNCFRSDSILGVYNPKNATVQPCMSGGLWDAGAAISVGGHHVANWLIGQVRDETQTEEKIREYARKIGADEDSAANAFSEVPAMSREKFNGVAEALFTLANQLSAMAYQNVQQARFISERKSAESALKVSENKLRTLFSAMSDIIIIYDKDGRYIEIAPTNLGKLYRPPEELLDHTISEIFDPETAGIFMETIHKTLATGEMVKVDYNLLIGNNNYWFSANVSPLDKSQVLWVARDITERKVVEESLQFQSNHDTLTGLFNRQYYETEILRLQQSRMFPISLMVLDVDGLKWVNDNRGHAAGDDLLRRVAGVLKSAFRPEDLVARMGGDEFVVILPETNRSTAAQVVQRLEAIINVHNSLYPIEQHLGLSIGVATGAQGAKLTEVFKEADEAMYAKKAIRKSRSRD
jgi:diguanylate cyclase (GGDEF)-like protein/PAS domain S-box-containing protein